MIKSNKIGLMVTVFAVLFSVVVSVSLQWIVAFIAIFTLGILHGANDLLILSKNKNTNTWGYRKALIIYLISVGVGGVLFFYLPQIALLVFVLVSCYHFGEQHWESFHFKSKYLSLFYFCYGGLIFFILFCVQFDTVETVIYQITGLQLPQTFFTWGLGIFSFLVLLFFIINKQLHATIVSELFLFALLIALFFLSDLVFGFAIYFVVWHSFPSLQSQLRFIYGNDSKDALKKYIKKSLPYWVAALSGLAVAYFTIDFKAHYFLPLFFSFLAAITFPHVFVMRFMFESTHKDRGGFKHNE